jgi:CubicO group peptidase (beta-lactamase class C family)
MMSYADVNYDLLGEIVHRVTGMDLSQFAAETIFKPLGMRDTYFKLPGELSNRVVKRPENAIYYDLTSRFAEASLGSLGVYSTSMDIAVFAQMFLNGGTYGDVRILSKASVDAMTRNQIPRISADVDGETIPEAEWGLGWAVHHTKKSWGWDELLQSQTSYGHGGAGGTMLKVDPAYDLVMVYFSVYLDLLENGRPNGNTDLFVNAVLASIEEL